MDKCKICPVNGSTVALPVCMFKFFEDVYTHAGGGWLCMGALIGTPD